MYVILVKRQTKFWSVFLGLVEVEKVTENELYLKLKKNS